MSIIKAKQFKVILNLHDGRCGLRAIATLVLGHESKWPEILKRFTPMKGNNQFSKHQKGNY